MKFSVISNLPESHGIVEAIRSASEHDIVAERTTPDDDSRLTLPMDGQTEVTHPAADAVLIAVDSQTVAVPLVRGAAEANKCVLWFPPHDLDSAGIYELTQIAIDHGVAIVPVRVSWWLPKDLLTRIKQRGGVAAEQPAESVVALVASLQLHVHCQRDAADIPRAAEFCAVDVARSLCGNAPQLTAIRIETPGGEVQQETITLGFGDGKSPEAGSDFPSQIIIDCATPSGDHPRAVISLSLDDGSTHSSEVTCPVIGHPSAEANLQVLANHIVPALTSAADNTGELTDFAKSEELFASIRESLRRRRTIDVYYDTASERSVFKTQMTAIGCGILTWLTFGLVAYLVMAELLEPPAWVLHTARILWLAPVVLFLLFQGLLPFTRSATSGNSQNSA